MEEVDQQRRHQKDPTSVMEIKEEVQRVHIRRNGRGLARKERGGVEPLHQKLPTVLELIPWLSFIVRSLTRKIVVAAKLDVAAKHHKHEAAEADHGHHPAQLHTRATISECLFVCGS